MMGRLQKEAVVARMRKFGILSTPSGSLFIVKESAPNVESLRNV